MEFTVTIDEDDAIEAIKEFTSDPEEVFDSSVLDDWANDNGFIHETDVGDWAEENGWVKACDELKLDYKETHVGSNCYVANTVDKQGNGVIYIKIVKLLPQPYHPIPDLPRCPDLPKLPVENIDRIITC